MYTKSKKTNGLTLKCETELEQNVQAFILTRKAMNVSKGTLYFYNAKFKVFLEFCSTKQIESILEISPSFIREFLMELREKEHNDGGVFAFYRVIKSLLLWYEDEYEPENWKNPIRKVPSPKVSTEPLEGIPVEDIYLLVEKCERGTFYGERDRTALLLLVETGVRATELLSIDVADIDFVESNVLIRQGKGRKPRTVFFGKTARKQLRTYLRIRNNNKGALFITKEFDRLTYNALREIVRRLSKKAGIREPGLHDFRRTFAIECLRKGIDIQTIARLMGHSSLQVISRYLKQTKTDLGSAYRSIIDTE